MKIHSEEKRAVLMELGGSHAECLHAQICYLSKGGYEIYMICDTSTWEQVEEKSLIKNVQLHNVKSGLFSQLAMVWKIHRYLRKHKISKLLVNTVGITSVRNIFLFHLPKRLECIGIAHDGEKLLKKSSLTLVVGKKMKKFFVLNDYIKKYIEQHQIKAHIESFYPIYFPKFKKVEISKPEGEIWFVVPGVVETYRRDYLGLLNELEKHSLHPLVKILFLGKMDVVKVPELVDKFEKIGLSKNQLATFDRFLSNEEFHSYIQHCDVMLPLIGEVGKSMYGFTRISGSFNLAFGYKIPFLIEEEMAGYDDFTGSSFFYKPSELVASINSFVDKRTELLLKKQEMANNPKWTEGNLQKKYLDFIERE